MKYGLEKRVCVNDTIRGKGWLCIQCALYANPILNVSLHTIMPFAQSIIALFSTICLTSSPFAATNLSSINRIIVYCCLLMVVRCIMCGYMCGVFVVVRCFAWLCMRTKRNRDMERTILLNS